MVGAEASSHNNNNTSNYHIALHTHGTSRYTALQQVRNAFPELREEQSSVTFFRGWGPLEKYVGSFDPDYLLSDEKGVQQQDPGQGACISKPTLC